MARTLELDTITEPGNSGTANITLSTDTTTTMPLVDINGGAIDGTTLGVASPSSVAATTLSTTGNATVGGTLGITGDLTVTGGDIKSSGGTTAISVSGANTTLAGTANNVGTVTTGTWAATDVAVAHGGTGASTFTDGGVLLGSGTSAVTSTAVLADGEILIGDGTTDPVALDVGSSSAITVLGTVATGTWEATDVAVAHGGTGASTLTDGGVLLGSGTGAITAMAVLADGEMIVGDGSTDPVAESGATLRTSLGLGTGNSPEFTGTKRPRLAGSVSATYPGYGTYWDTSGWTKGLYVFESLYSGAGAGSGWGYIRKGYNDVLNVFICSASYTSFQFSGTSFQVQQGLSWATTLTFTGSVWKILEF